VACWLAEISYSFETGMLFMKKGQAVQERLLVSGIFPLRPNLIMTAPKYLVTDIFSVQSESGFMERIKGNEKSLTTGIGYSYLGHAKKASIPRTFPSQQASTAFVVLLILMKIVGVSSASLLLFIPRLSMLIV
jgi:hypothetical protein